MQMQVRTQVDQALGSFYQAGKHIGCDDIDGIDFLRGRLIHAGIVDHGIKSPPCVRLVGNVFRFLKVGQIPGYDMCGAWHMLLCLVPALGIARMEDDLVSLLDQ